MSSEKSGHFGVGRGRPRRVFGGVENRAGLADTKKQGKVCRALGAELVVPALGAPQGCP